MSVDFDFGLIDCFRLRFPNLERLDRLLYGEKYIKSVPKEDFSLGKIKERAVHEVTLMYRAFLSRACMFWGCFAVLTMTHDPSAKTHFPMRIVENVVFFFHLTNFPKSSLLCMNVDHVHE